MKRTISDDMEGLSIVKKRRIESDGNMAEDDIYEPEQDELFSDVESQHAGTISTLQTITPPTPLSPAHHKFPSDAKKIKCTYPGCHKTFNRPARLAAHLNSHTNERPYKCTYAGCDKDYTDQKHLRQHIKGTHTDERDHVCEEAGCGKSFTTATRLRRHQLVHEGAERFRCRDFPPCNQSFRKHQTLERHIRSEHLHVPKFLCNHRDGDAAVACGAGFDSAGSLRRHQEQEHGEKRYWCDECSTQLDEHGKPKQSGFSSMAALQSHMRQLHVPCMFCGLSCSGRAELEHHLETEHANMTIHERKQNAVVCVWPGCKRTFAKKSNMNAHIRSFHGGVRFVCGEYDLRGAAQDLAAWAGGSRGCGEAFVTKGNLENHVRHVHLKQARPALETSKTTSVAGKVAKVGVLDRLAGVGESSRQTLPCMVAGCGLKFAHKGELDAHLDSQHTIEKALMDADHETVDVDNGPILDYSMAFGADMVPGEDLDFAGSGGGGLTGDEFWVGGGGSNDDLLQSLYPGIDEEWLRDEAEMRQLIGSDDTGGNGENGPNLSTGDLDSLIDPALDQVP